jgi:hypothetical protein
LHPLLHHGRVELTLAATASAFAATTKAATTKPAAAAKTALSATTPLVLRMSGKRSDEHHGDTQQDCQPCTHGECLPIEVREFFSRKF